MKNRKYTNNFVLMILHLCCVFNDLTYYHYINNCRSWFNDFSTKVDKIVICSRIPFALPHVWIRQIHVQDSKSLGSIYLCVILTKICLSCLCGKCMYNKRISSLVIWQGNVSYKDCQIDSYCWTWNPNNRGHIERGVKSRQNNVHVNEHKQSCWKSTEGETNRGVEIVNGTNILISNLCFRRLQI